MDETARVTRRAFLTGVTGAAPWLGAIAMSAQRGGSSPTDTRGAPRVNAQDLRQRLEQLSQFGRPAGGTFADGVSRVAYSDADVAGRRYVMGLMRAAGLSPRIDPAGNIFGTRAGSDPALPPILFGSHIDSVPSGGNFDGDLGSLSAVSALEAIALAGIRTRHSLEMVVWAHEEGVAFNRGLACSRIVAGDIKPADLDQVWNGMTRGDAIRKIGGDPDRIMDARRPKGSFHCYLELHIEQGGSLDRAGIPIGVVQGIVAIDRYDAVITGFANHAGTTPMNERRDALVAAAQLTLAVREIATSEPGRQVGTVGHLDIEPNAPNVIPGVARLAIEFRDLSEATLRRIGEALRARVRDIASRTATTIELKPTAVAAPATASPSVQEAIARAAGSLGLKTMGLPSGAGHDAQMMAQLGPMGMIFVPSIGGISHSPKELTRWDDCARGADVLLYAVLAMDRSGQA